MKQAPSRRVTQGLGDELEPSAVELLLFFHAGATFPFSGRPNELHESWTELRARDFEFLPSVVARRSIVEIQPHHSFPQQGPIHTPLDCGRRYHPDASQLHLA